MAKAAVRARVRVADLGRAEGAIIVVREADPDGRVVEHGRVVDVLDSLRSGMWIDDVAFSAGRAFQRDFEMGGLNAMPMSKLEWSPGGGGGLAEITDRQCDARKRLHQAVQVLGGHGSAAASVVWGVIGEGRSIHDFARRGGSRFNWHNLRGVLVTALTVMGANKPYGA